MTFEQATATYVHRFTVDHVPQWAARPRVDGYYAPMYASDREWYRLTVFPGDPDYPEWCADGECHSQAPTWPYGKRLAQPFLPSQTGAYHGE